MEITMKKILIASSFTASLVLAACSQAEAPAKQTTETKTPITSTTQAAISTKTKAVLVYADWCGSCKVLDPKLQTAKNMGKIPGLEYVTLDYTRKNENVF